MKIPNDKLCASASNLSLARIVSEDSQPITMSEANRIKSSKDS